MPFIDISISISSTIVELDWQWLDEPRDLAEVTARVRILLSRPSGNGKRADPHKKWIGIPQALQCHSWGNIMYAYIFRQGLGTGA